MDKEEIIKLAKDAGLDNLLESSWCMECGGCNVDQLEDFAKRVLWSDKLFQSLIKGERIAERNRIIELLMELHKQAADSHNHYHYAANKVKELK